MEIDQFDAEELEISNPTHIITDLNLSHLCVSFDIHNTDLFVDSTQKNIQLKTRECFESFESMPEMNNLTAIETECDANLSKLMISMDSNVSYEFIKFNSPNKKTCSTPLKPKGIITLM